MKKIIQFLLVLNAISVLSQDGQLDFTFNPTINLTGTIHAIKEQQDGKILIGGSIISSIRRLNSDGTTDTSFGNGVNFSGTVFDIAIQNDNKIIVVGAYPSYIKRLNEDGTVDTSFILYGTINGWIKKVAILESGKIIVAGVFDNINNIPIEGVARFNADGSLDTTFNLNLPPHTGIRALDVQPDGKILIAGQNDEAAQYRIFRRYFQDGTLDTSFNGDEDYYIYDIEVEQGGNIMICGPFTEYNNSTRYNIARLNSDGTLDNTFDSYNLPQNGATYTIFDVSIINDGNYIINGSFNIYNDITTKYIAKINHDGTINASFNIGTGPNNFIWETFIQNDGKIIIGGDFKTYNGTSINKIARLGNTLLSTNTTEFLNGILIYPNPVGNNLNIKITDKVKIGASIAIYTLTGQLIKTKALEKNKIINLSTLENGTYLIQVKNGNQTYTQKIIKQ